MPGPRNHWAATKMTPEKLAGLKVQAEKRSGLEDRIAAQLESMGVTFEYETKRYDYAITHKYKPDFHLPNGIIIEAKGRFTSDMRTKHLAVKKANPELDVRFVFSRSKSKISKESKTTCAEWCEKHGFKYADKLIPAEWLNEREK